MKVTLKQKKQVYSILVETYAKFGYSVIDLLNPNYSKIDFLKVIDLVIDLHKHHEEEVEEFQLEKMQELKEILIIN